VSVQPGILAIGTTDHCYLEFDRLAAAHVVVTAVAALADELDTTAGVNLVIGVRPSLWQEVAPAADVPAGIEDWEDDLVGPDGYTMPATPHDLWFWVSGGDRGTVFDAARAVMAELRPVAQLGSEIGGWVYRHNRDLTGFVDGTKNPKPVEAQTVVATPLGSPGVGSTVVLYQLWTHDSARWEAEPTSAQERAMGRTKADSVELAEADMPVDSHVSRTSIEVDGEELHIFRRNVAYGGVTDHGTVFVGFSHDQWRLAEMLRRMAGVSDGIRCALTRYVTSTAGAYYVVPSVDALARTQARR
jgi:porphyrinogen peroxidase